MKHSLTHLSKSASDQSKRRQPSPPKTSPRKASPRSSHSSHTKKPANPYLGIKSSIMVLSIVGTMAGWLFLLETEGLETEGLSSQELQSQQVASPVPEQVPEQVSGLATTQSGAELMTVSSMNINFENSDVAAAPRAVDISKLRRVNDNEVAPIAEANPVTPVKVVARTRSSR